MKEVLLWLWQLPQNLIGFIISRTCMHEICIIPWHDSYVREHFFHSAISLGDYRIYEIGHNSVTTCKHEFGHSLQSRKLGWFYLIIIGIPSILCNIYDRLFHTKWTNKERFDWYHNLPWEKWADELRRLYEVSNK